MDEAEEAERDQGRGGDRQVSESRDDLERQEQEVSPDDELRVDEPASTRESRWRTRKCLRNVSSTAVLERTHAHAVCEDERRRQDAFERAEGFGQPVELVHRRRMYRSPADVSSRDEKDMMPHSINLRWAMAVKKVLR